jgi:hypothetical protein
MAITKLEAADEIIKLTHKKTPMAKARMLGFMPVLSLTIFKD